MPQLNMPKVDLYKWPNYGPNIASGLSSFCQGDTFGQWNLGDLYDSVPTEYAQKMDCAYGIFVNSGTAGLHAALMACGLKPGDEVIVPAMTFIRAVTPLAHLQLKPVLVDVDPKTGNICPAAVQKAITSKTKAVIVVHMWGVPADCASLANLCNSHGLSMIEDCSHAHFSEVNGRAVGSFGRVGFLSLQRKKLTSVGEGGLIATNDPVVFERLKDITSPGSFVPPGTHYSQVDFSGFGLNMRMSPFSAVVAKNLLPEIDQLIAARAKAVEIFTEALSSQSSVAYPVEIPSYVSKVSWYSYKPQLKAGSLASLMEQGGLTRWGAFGYPTIAEHGFWKKSTDCFPFCSLEQPRVSGSLLGLSDYLKDRVTLNLPNVSSDYWTEENRSIWAREFLTSLATRQGVA